MLILLNVINYTIVFLSKQHLLIIFSIFWLNINIIIEKQI